LSNNSSVEQHTTRIAKLVFDHFTADYDENQWKKQKKQKAKQTQSKISKEVSRAQFLVMQP